MPVPLDRSLRLPAAEYFAEPQAKSGIALHHTVSERAHATVHFWETDRTALGNPRRVATAYMIDRDGTIHELFDPSHWAFHFGVPWPDAARVAFEKRFIGIEIASEGGLTQVNGELYCYDIVNPIFRKDAAEAFECPALYRGYKWFDRYEPEQIDALGRLVDELCERFAIPRRYPARPFVYYGDRLKSFEGVIGHANVRLDKSDPAPDPALWQALEHLARLEPTEVAAPESLRHADLSVEEIEALFERNARRIDRMDVAAGSAVKNLLMELERRDMYLELDTPEPGAHEVEYDIAWAKQEIVQALANKLGFASAAGGKLEVTDE
jgi:hypothetical protein